LAVVFPKDKPTVDLQGTKDKTCNVLAYTEEVKEKGKVKDVLVIAGCDNLTCTDTTKECQLGYRANAKDPTILELHCWCAQPPK